MYDLISCCRGLKEASLSYCRTVQATIDWFGDPFFSKDEQAAAKQVRLFRHTISNTLHRLGPPCRRWDSCRRLSDVFEALKCVHDGTLAPITVGQRSYATAHEAARAFAEATVTVVSATDADDDVALYSAVKYRLAQLGYKNLRSRIESEFYAVVASQLSPRTNETKLATVDVESEFEAPCEEAECLWKTDLIDIFGLPRRRLEAFLANHPEVRMLRPPTHAGNPNSKRRNIHVVDFIEALRQDDYSVNARLIRQRLEAELNRGGANKALLDVALTALLVEFPSAISQIASFTRA